MKKPNPELATRLNELATVMPASDSGQPKYARQHIYLGVMGQQLIGQAKYVSERVETIMRRFDYFRQASLATVRERFTVLDWTVFTLALRKGAGLVEYDSWQHVLTWAHQYRESFQGIYSADPIDSAYQLRDAGEWVCIAVVDTVEQYWDKPVNMHHADRLQVLGVITHEQMREWKAGDAQRRAARHRLEKAAREMAAEAKID